MGPTPPRRLPPGPETLIGPPREADGDRLRNVVRLPHRKLRLRVWRVRLGRILRILWLR